MHFVSIFHVKLKCLPIFTRKIIYFRITEVIFKMTIVRKTLNILTKFKSFAEYSQTHPQYETKLHPIQQCTGPL